MLALREFRPSDSKKLIALLNDFEVTRYLSSIVPFPYSAEDAEWWKLVQRVVISVQ